MNREIRDVREIRTRPLAKRTRFLCLFNHCDGARFALSQSRRRNDCRVDRLIEPDLAVLRISGRITAQELEVLRAAVEEESGAVVIDLKDVGLIDGDAVRFFASIEANGDVLRNCPAFIREWVNRERAQTRPDQSDA